jgi:hypothetical protein
MPVAPSDIFELTGLQPFMAAEDARTLPAKIVAGLTNVPRGSILAESTLTQNQTHTLAANGATAGNFTLTFRGYTTTALAHTCTNAQLQAALEALPSIGTGGVVVTGGALNTATPLTMTWSGANFTNQPVELPVLTITVAFATTQPTLATGNTGQRAGTYVLYNDAGSNGANVAKAINKYRFSTDASGKISLADLPNGEQFGQERDTIPVYYAGNFHTADLQLTAISGLTGGILDAAGVTDLGKFITGSLTAGGVIKIGV